MEPCTTVDLRCLICRRVTLENLSIDSQVLSSNASLLHDFLNCFHVNYLDTDVNDLSTSCHLCLTCEQFIAEWSSIQTQMTQLTRRNAQLKATLSALLLSEHEIQERIPNEDVSDINNRIHNAQEIQLPLLLHQTVDDIRNELRRKYSARVLLDKIQLPPPVPKLEHLPTVNVTADEAWDHWECEENIQFPLVPKLDPVSASYDNEDEPWDHSDVGADDPDMEYLLSENDAEASKRIHEMRPATEKDASSNCSHLQNSNKTRKVKGGNRKTTECPRKSKKQPVVIPVRHKKCRYNGFDVVAHPPQDFESNDHEDPIGEEPEVATAAVEEPGLSVPHASSSGAQPDDDLAKKRASMRHTCPDCGKSMFRSERYYHDLRSCQQTCEICGKKASRQAMPNHKCKEALKCTVTHKNPNVCKGYYKTAKALGEHIRQTSGVCECGEYLRGRDKAKHVCGFKNKKR